VFRNLRPFLALLVLGTAACGRSELEPTRDRLPAAARAPAATAIPAAPTAAASIDCESRIRQLRSQPGLLGAPSLGSPAARAELLANAKGEPAVFVQRPEPEPGVRDAARVYAAQLARTDYPWDVLGTLLPTFEAEPELGRQTVLRDGYLYTEAPKLGFALVDRIAAHHVASEPRIWIQRGERTSWAVRRPDGRYIWQDGPERGRAVRLLLFDRIGVGTPPVALHRDFRALRYRLSFDRAEIRHLTADHVVADLRYGGRYWVPTLLRAEGARLELECESIAPAEASPVTDARMRSARSERALRALRRSMLAQIEEALPFDEPLTEVGQQDGRLRPSWRWTYLQGKQGYRFNGDLYPIFDARGRPRPPQVCIDFMLDTLERASGTWWKPQGKPPGKARGALDFDEHGRDQLRSISAFVEFARSKPDWFELLTPPLVPIGRLDRLASELTLRADDYENGDMLFIFGKTPWDPHTPHYHSFYVYETDPLTGFPIAIVGNAGRPTIRVWRLEAMRTPKRALVHRIRPRLEWLESIVPALEDPALVPPPLVAGRRPE
jgi:hypothetical protein